jgi:predicted Fe-Mo cluster-binding NifX family protein
MLLEASGVRVISHICGRVEDVVEAFIADRLLKEEKFIMPGCTSRPEDALPETQNGSDARTARNGVMKIAITSQGPDVESQLDPRFGRSRYVILVDTATREVAVQDNRENLQAVQGAGIRVARDIVRSGAGAVITGNVGSKALEVLETAHVDIYQGDELTVGEALDQFRGGQLVTRSKENAA